MDDTLSGGTLTAPAPDNPLLAAAHAALADVMTNAQHPDHLAYLRNDPAVHARIHGLYKKAFPDSAPQSTPTPHSNPAGLAATEEHAKIMSDPSHPMHAGYLRGDKKALDYVADLYRNAYPGTAPVEDNHGLSVTTGSTDESAPTLSPEDARAVEEIRQESGEQFQEHHADAQFGLLRIQRVFGGEADDLGAAVLAAGGNLKMLWNIARHFGKQARTYAP
jgi:hypothetical protein